MPARKTWLLRLRQIREELSALDVPVIDRAVFERIFGLRRRRAIQLMHYFGGFQSSQAFLLDRLDLLRQLEPLEASAEFALELRRRQRLVDALDKLRRSQSGVRGSIPVAPDGRDRSMADLPAGVRLEPGSLRVDFARAEDLLGKLFEF